MTLLATIAPMLAGGNQFAFTVASVNGALRIVTNPTIANFKPDTTDEELAAIQSALVMPVVMTIPLDGTDPDAALAELLRQAQALRQPSLDRLAAFNDAQREAANAAQIAKDKKNEKPAAAKGATKAADKTDPKKKGTGLTVGSLAASDTASDDDAGDDEGNGDGAEAVADAPSVADEPISAPAAPAVTANLFVD